MPSSVRTLRIVAVLGMFALVSGALAADWPCWRGPNHDGVSPDKDFQTKWDAPPPVVWENELGSAFSGLTCVGGKVYTCGAKDKQQVLFCLDAASGKIAWQTPIEKEFPDKQGGDGTRATPTCDDGRVFILGAFGRLLCVDAKDGKEVWSREFKAKPRWGYSASVLVEGDLAIVTAGGDDGALLAVDKKTGKTVWKCGADPVGYATPYPFTFEGGRYIVGFLGKSVVIAEAKTGRVVFDMPWETSYDVNAATPIFHDGHLFLSSGYNHGAILLKLGRDGDKLTGTKVWESKAIRAKFQTPVLIDGFLYDSDEVGLKCVEFATGTEKWSKKGMTFGTIVAADGYLVLLTEGGELIFAKASPEKFEPISKQPILSGRCWTIPTLCDGRLYARNFERAVCVKLTK